MSKLYDELVELGHIDEDLVDVDDEYAHEDLCLLIGSAIAVVGIICITVGVAFFLSMYQTVGWLS